MRIVFSVLFVIFVYSVITTVNMQYRVQQEPMMYEYVTRNFEEDTAARNAVTAIILNYRMYDTLFEALILLTAIVGMHQFLPRAVDMKADGETERE